MTIVNPITRKGRYTRPFNDIKPIGVGDLKVVKQWLIAYLPGEISHIENVLKGEIKNRTHRRLEKTEEAFTFSSNSKESSQKDTQTTERGELKSEVDNIVKTELSAGASVGINATYQGTSYTIAGNVGANFSYKRDATDQSKISSTLARDVVSKAIEQVEKNVAESRSVTKLFETEETNVHGFDNKGGQKHITGIYRWLDKKYKAQLFNYGKHMMFEFMIPEPAAFFVESRLRAFEAGLEVPQLPEKPNEETVSLKLSSGIPLTPELIDLAELEVLQLKYDFLVDDVYPPKDRQMSFVDSTTGESFFTGSSPLEDDMLAGASYSCKHTAAGYEIKSLIVEGMLAFEDKTATPAADTGTGGAQNTLIIWINGVVVVRHHSILNPTPSQSFQYYFNRRFVLRTLLLGGGPEPLPADLLPPLLKPMLPMVLTDANIDLKLGVWDRKYSSLAITAELELTDAALLKWQLGVFNKVRAFEQKKVDKINQEKQVVYNSEMSTYRNRMNELKATSVNDLLQGQSEAFNREVIRTELKKHCLTMLTKEFDDDESDDLIGKKDLNSIGTNRGKFRHSKFDIDEKEATADNPASTTAEFKVYEPKIDYPAIKLDEAKKKGRFIQFLEQAFEWQQLAYIFYPYFWAARPKWIDMMNRSDDADANMSAFLQAGSVKVLIAVTNGYEEAVPHFIATREPWEGGPAPIIGDPLFIPIHEEIRKRQDDLYNATPEGEPWTFTLPTSLVYLDDSGVTLPTFPDIDVSST